MDQEPGKTCQTCGYFRQHYIWHYGYMPVASCHCTHPPRNRSCRPGQTACPKWIPQAEAYRKKYLPPQV